MVCFNYFYRLIAAKTYYFGVGGGTREFEALVRKDAALTSKVYSFLYTSVSTNLLSNRYAHLLSFFYYFTSTLWK